MPQLLPINVIRRRINKYLPALDLLPSVMNIIFLSAILCSLICDSRPVKTKSRFSARSMIWVSVAVTCFDSRFPTSPIPQMLAVPVTRMYESSWTFPSASRKLGGSHPVLIWRPKRGRYRSVVSISPFDRTSFV